MTTEDVPLVATWKTLAKAAEKQVAAALAQRDDEAAAEIAAKARADAAVDADRRLAAQLRLSAAIACAHPEDSRALMSAALTDLGAGMPDPQHPFSRLREDAAYWADLATEAEVCEFVAAGLRRLEGAPMAIGLRKRLLVALFGSLPLADRKVFLGRVDPRGQFQGRNI